jgi:carbonic anhydrase
VTELAALLAAAKAYAEGCPNVADPRPTRGLAVVTCMDARIDVGSLLGLRIGEAHLIRNAGGRVTDDVLRSLALSTKAMGVDTVVVMQHTGCGIAGVTDQELRRRTGADIDFFTITDHAAALRSDIDVLIDTAYLEPVTLVAGLLYDIDSGDLDEIVRRERPR